MTTPWKTYVLLISACQFTFEAWLNIRQFHALKKIAVPRIVSENLDKHTVEKSHAYKREKTKLSLASGLWGQVINFLVIYFDGLPWLWDAMGQWLGGSGLFTPTDTSRSIAFAVGYLWFSNCVFLPVQLYDTFVIESTFGFNKQTPGLFLCDFLKIQALNAAILAPSLALFLAIVARTGDSFAFYVWLGMTVIQALIITLDPILFTPLFNTLRPITDDKLLPKVQALATKAGFPLNRLYVSDSSKRSAHSNAYFYGFPWQMQVVVQDTLLQKHSSDEITAVIAHEFGHWKSQHSAKSFLMQQANLLLVFLCFAAFAGSPNLYSSFGFQSERPLIAGFVLFIKVLLPLNSFLDFAQNVMSRKYEYSADQFAKALGHGHELVSALVKLHAQNLGVVSSDYIYACYHNSHPSLIERITQLEMKEKH